MNADEAEPRNPSSVQMARELALRYRDTPVMRHGCSAVLFAHLLGEHYAIDPLSDLAQKAALFFGECASLEALWRLEAACGESWPIETEFPRESCEYESIAANILQAMGLVDRKLQSAFVIELLREGHRLYRDLNPSKNTTENTTVGNEPPSEMMLLP